MSIIDPIQRPLKIVRMCVIIVLLAMSLLATQGLKELFRLTLW